MSNPATVKDVHKATGGGIVVVTGLWGLPNKRSKEGGSSALSIYDKWMKHTVRINATFHIFGNAMGLEHVRAARDAWAEAAGAATTYQLLECVEFRAARVLAAGGFPNRTCGGTWVWAEKVELVRRAAERTRPAAHGGYDWFAWVDIGINVYRERWTRRRWPGHRRGQTSPGCLAIGSS